MDTGVAKAFESGKVLEEIGYRFKILKSISLVLLSVADWEI